ncbi:MAG: acyltransferase [Bacteroidales bacterium]|jgi:acetyltransferase-like isoleucine patch superfamily enzyme|nr:acyltransferase [Bacteroidales bacterium]
MGKIITYLTLQLGRLLSRLYPYSVSQKTGYYANMLYTAWTSRMFKNFGKNSIIYRKAELAGARYISIGNNVEIYRNAMLAAWDTYGGQTLYPEIFIGDGSTIGEHCHISAINRIVFGKNVAAGNWFTVLDNNHGELTIDSLNVPPLSRPLFSKGPVSIGDNVWLGDKVTVLAGVTIGKNSIIGANSVVTKSIPANCVAAGIPAKVIRTIHLQEK